MGVEGYKGKDKRSCQARHKVKRAVWGFGGLKGIFSNVRVLWFGVVVRSRKSEYKGGGSGVGRLIVPS